MVAAESERGRPIKFKPPSSGHALEIERRTVQGFQTVNEHFLDTHPQKVLLAITGTSKSKVICVASTIVWPGLGGGWKIDHPELSTELKSQSHIIPQPDRQITPVWNRSALGCSPDSIGAFRIERRTRSVVGPACMITLRSFETS
jgi:hypothetical protein